MIERNGYALLSESYMGNISLLGRATTDEGVRGVENLKTNGLELFPTLSEAKRIASGYQQVSWRPVEFALISLKLPQTRSEFERLRGSTGLVAVTRESNPHWEKPLMDLYGPDLDNLQNGFEPNYAPLTGNNLTSYRASQFNVPTPFERARIASKVLKSDERDAAIGRFRIKRVRAA